MSKPSRCLHLRSLSRGAVLVLLLAGALALALPARGRPESEARAQAASGPDQPALPDPFPDEDGEFEGPSALPPEAGSTDSAPARSEGSSPEPGAVERVEPREPPPALHTEPPVAWVREAIQDFLDLQNPARRQKGQVLLERAGLAVVPQLRYWLERVRFEADLVENLLRRILEASGRPDEVVTPIRRAMPLGDFYREKLLEAKELARTGQYADARRIVEALLALDAESPVAWELRRIQRDARDRMVREELLEPRIDSDSLISEVGEEPKVTFRVINRSRKKARIELRDGHLGRLFLTIERRAVTGERQVERRAVSLATERRQREIILGPGEIWVQRIAVPEPQELIDLSGVVGRLTIEGEFRPYRWTFLDAAKDTEHNLLVSIAPCEIWLVPPASKRGLDSPLSSLVAALFFGKVEKLLVAGQIAVWAAEKDPVLNRELVEVLVGHLDELDGVRQHLAVLFLQAASGEYLKTPGEWTAWWEAIRSGSARRRAPPGELRRHATRRSTDGG